MTLRATITEEPRFVVEQVPELNDDPAFRLPSVWWLTIEGEYGEPFAYPQIELGHETMVGTVSEPVTVSRDFLANWNRFRARLDNVHPLVPRA